MLRRLFVPKGIPMSYPVDPSASFQPGQIAQLYTAGDTIVCGVSDGTAPIGIIDSVRTTAFTAPSRDEIVIVPCVATSDGYQLVAAVNTDKNLMNPHIIRSSFVSDTENITLNEINGIITVAAGTPLNFDRDGDGILDSVKVIVSYYYRIPNVAGDDDTVGSGRLALWIDRGFYETDQYDQSAPYIVNATLYCDGNGVLTTQQPTASHPGIAMVTGPPTGVQPTLEFLWF